MTANIMSGKILSEKIKVDLKEKIITENIKPCLAIILVGDNEASKIYVKHKLKSADEIGIETSLYVFEENISQEKLESLIEQLNQNTKVNGIMVQLPLPKHIDEKKILDLILPIKDVDGFHPYNVGLLQNADLRAMIAATPKGIIRLLEEHNIKFEGKNAVVIGRSQIVGKPIAMLLLNKNCTVTIAHSKTQHLEKLLKQADIVISACGCPQLIKGKWLKKGAVVVDVGINRIDGKLCGDVYFDEAKEVASYITPVPGGVGPMTIAMLLRNTYVTTINSYKK